MSTPKLISGTLTPPPEFTPGPTAEERGRLQFAHQIVRPKPPRRGAYGPEHEALTTPEERHLSDDALLALGRERIPGLYAAVNNRARLDALLDLVYVADPVAEDALWSIALRAERLVADRTATDDTRRLMWMTETRREISAGTPERLRPEIKSRIHDLWPEVLRIAARAASRSAGQANDAE